MAEAVAPGRIERVRRFTTAQIIEHWLQMIAFVMLVTGCLRLARQMGADRVRTHARDDRGRAFFLHHRFQPVDEPYLERVL